MIEELLSLLPSGLTNTPDSNIAKFLKIAIESMYIPEILIDIDKLSGNDLDEYGKLVGVGRNGQDDDFYKLMIKQKLSSIKGNGSVNSIIKSVKNIYPDANFNIVKAEDEPNAYEVTGVDPTFFDNDFKLDYFSRIIIEATAAGINLRRAVKAQLTEGRVFIAGIPTSQRFIEIKGVAK